MTAESQLVVLYPTDDFLADALFERFSEDFDPNDLFGAYYNGLAGHVQRPLAQRLAEYAAEFDCEAICALPDLAEAVRQHPGGVAYAVVFPLPERMHAVLTACRLLRDRATAREPPEDVKQLIRAYVEAQGIHDSQILRLA
jgi:hypothetical protein